MLTGWVVQISIRWMLKGSWDKKKRRHEIKFSRISISHSLLPKVHLMDEFDIVSIVGEGWFGKILLVEHKATDTEMVLKGEL